MLSERGFRDSRFKLNGVDIDQQAIDALRHRLSHERNQSETKIVCGDALTGPAFGEPPHNGQRGVDWSRTFPETATAGGFDLVIGNPPYLREKNAKLVFDRIADSPLGKRWRQPRMDLWHYFLHRGLDLLKPDGVLSFIVNSYWTSATSARRLIERLREETTIERIVLLGEQPIFAGVSGRHMILQLRRGRTETPCQVLDLTSSSDVLDVLEQTSVHDAEGSFLNSEAMLTQPQSMLFDSGRLIVKAERTNGARLIGQERLGERFVIRQGIAENPPFVTRRMARESGDTLSIGAGVFVLTSEEVQTLQLGPRERQLLRPYFTAASVHRYEMPAESTHWLLYLTPNTAPEIVRFPGIMGHLQPFRETLERRREVRSGAIAWWHLHWPRRESLFIEPRILAKQMGRQPAFVYAEQPTFVGFAMNVIQSPTDGSQTRFSLPALTVLLNSQAAARWFALHAKHRGVRLDISGGVLRSFPMPSYDSGLDAKLAELCLQKQSLAIEGDSSDDAQAVEAQIEKVVGLLYDH